MTDDFGIGGGFFLGGYEKITSSHEQFQVGYRQVEYFTCDRNLGTAL
jgi:hypothetical protein